MLYSFFSLRDKHSIVIIGYEKLSKWLVGFSKILNLKTTKTLPLNTSSKIILLSSCHTLTGSVGTLNLPQALKKYLPVKGWIPQKFKPYRIWTHKKTPDIIFEINNQRDYNLKIVRMQNLLFLIYLTFLNKGLLPVHSALVSYKGKGVLLLGPGGAGKTTCCKRLPKSWKVHGDDQAIILCDKKNINVKPSPTWSNFFESPRSKTCNSDQSLSLSKIIFISKSKNDKIKPLGQGETALKMFKQSKDVCFHMIERLNHIDKADSYKTMFDNACFVAKTVPAYKLSVSLEGEFWKLIEKVF